MSQRPDEREGGDRSDIWVSRSIDRSEAERQELYSVEQKEPRVSVSRILPFVEYQNGELHITRKFQR